MTPTLKIGILGTRGIPNTYGGFEQFAQYLSLGLIERGHKVWVYNSHNHPYKLSNYNGVNIIHCKDWEHKIGTAGQFIYDYNCIKDARNRDFDILLQLGYTSNSIWYFKWPRKAVNVLNMDGLEWKRSKYSKLTKRFLKYAEGLAAKNAEVLIADSVGIQAYLKSKYQKDSMYIPYGASVVEAQNSDVLQEYNIKPKEYYLLIARIEPENNIEMIIRGYLSSKKKHPLIIVGNSQNKFGQYLTEKYQDIDVRFVGAIYNQPTINTIRFYSSIYFHGHSVGGTNPSLLEAMACECNIAAHDNVFNKAILNDDAFYFSSAEKICQIIDETAGSPSVFVRTKNNIDKIQRFYTWDKIIDSYEKVFIGSFKSQNL